MFRQIIMVNFYIGVEGSCSLIHNKHLCLMVFQVAQNGHRLKQVVLRMIRVFVGSEITDKNLNYKIFTDKRWSAI